MASCRKVKAKLDACDAEIQMYGTYVERPVMVMKKAFHITDESIS